MFRAVYHADPDDETELSFLAACAILPRSVRRRFGIAEAQGEFAEADDDRERERLDGYTNWDAENAGSD